MSARPTNRGSSAAHPVATRFVSAVSGDENGRFSVDVVGLLEALTEQFPEPLLCVRELVQNAADAGAQRIDVDVAFDERLQLVRLSVLDDGRGMSSQEVEGYLTIGFSQKDPTLDRGRFGIGKLSPYALGFAQMVVETCNGQETHRIEFQPDGSGRILVRPIQRRGTKVSIYKFADRVQAEELSERTYALVNESCGSLQIPLLVNEVAVNHVPDLPTPYVVRFESDSGGGIVGVGGDLSCTLSSGGIVLEVGATILGQEVSYLLDAPRLSPTLSRNAVRRDSAFNDLLQVAEAQLPHLLQVTVQMLRQRVDRFRQLGSVTERSLEPNDRAALEWLRAQLLETTSLVSGELAQAPVLETVDGDLVSAQRLMDVCQKERTVPVSRVPLSREEIAGYADRGVPVLLFYRDLEDFLNRQSIPIIEVDGWDNGVEHHPTAWTKGEKALLERTRPPWKFLTKYKFAAAVGVMVLMLFLGQERWQGRAIPVGTPPSSASLEEPSSVVSTYEVSIKDTGQLAVYAPVVRRAESIPAVSWSLLLVTATMVCVGGWVVVIERLRRRQVMMGLHAHKAKLPIIWGDGHQRRLELLVRMLRHPIDFLVARGWSHRVRRGNGVIVAGYRAFVPEEPVRAGTRLDLDHLQLGYIDLVSRQGDPSDARLTIQRDGRILLNRNHPTVRNLILIAKSDSPRARVLLDALLATDPELAKGCDPRQIEWDLVGRAPRMMRQPKEHAG
ncbi:MAG: ATP-binding protein [Myxococcales bacterium]|nr:ATP-binding protein [Myxococcales bacterium]